MEGWDRFSKGPKSRSKLGIRNLSVYTHMWTSHPFTDVHFPALRLYGDDDAKTPHPEPLYVIKAGTHTPPSFLRLGHAVAHSRAHVAENAADFTLQ